MSWYKEYKSQWKEIIEAVAAEEHRTTQMVEKDTIQWINVHKEPLCGEQRDLRGHAVFSSASFAKPID